MRIAAILYITVSVAANFIAGSLATFVLAALSFPLLLWLLAGKKKAKSPVTQNGDGEINNPGVS